MRHQVGYTASEIITFCPYCGTTHDRRNVCQQEHDAWAKRAQEEVHTSPNNPYPYGATDAHVTADDIKSDESFYAAEYHAEAHECDACGEDTHNEGWCDQCQTDYDADMSRIEAFWNPVIVPDLSDIPFLEVDLTPAVHVCATCENRIPLSRERCDACNARIAAETAATIAAEPDLMPLSITIDPCRPEEEDALQQMLTTVMIKANLRKTLTGAALFAVLLPAHASAHDLPLVPTDGECAITRQFEDGSATAQCGHDTWAFDADGGFITDHGITFYYRDPGTWYQVN